MASVESGPVATGTHLATWTGPEVIAEYRTAHTAYRAARTDTYRAYFAANPHLKADDDAYKAKTLAAALPDVAERGRRSATTPCGLPSAGVGAGSATWVSCAWTRRRPRR